MEGEGVTLERFGSERKWTPASANKSKLNQAKLHTDTYMRTYTKGQNKTKQNKGHRIVDLTPPWS